MVLATLYIRAPKSAMTNQKSGINGMS